MDAAKSGWGEVAIDVVFDNKSIRREDARIFAPEIMFADFAFSTENYLLFFAAAIDVVFDNMSIRKNDARDFAPKIMFADFAFSSEN